MYLPFIAFNSKKKEKEEPEEEPEEEEEEEEEEEWNGMTAHVFITQ